MVAMRVSSLAVEVLLTSALLPASGSLNKALDALTVTATGTVVGSTPIHGSAAITLAPLTTAATGIVFTPVSGSAAVILAPLSVVATGKVLISGSVTVTLDDMTVFAAGVEFENLAVWPFMPDWQNDVTETLSWLTGLLSSRTSVEQRFGLRLTPRRSFEATFKPIGRFRTLFDLFILRVGGSSFYIPIWHDSNKLTVAAAAGDYSVDIGSTAFTEFQDSPGVFIGGPSRYEIAAYNGQNSSQVGLATALVNSWPKGTRVFPIQKVQLDAQPQAAGKADRAYEVRMRFRSVGGHRCSFETDIPLLLGKYVLEVEPNYAQDLPYNYDRVIAELDNQTGFSVRKDIKTYGHTSQQYAFYLKGRERHAWFRAFMYALRGRQVPIYVPTFMSDLELTENVSGPTMTVKRCGYTEFLGPFPGRDRIVILLHDGTRHYRRVVSSVVIDDDTESLSLSPALFLAKNLVHRISFIPFSRLDQDDIEIVHHTDSSGLSTVTTIFKGIPDGLASAAIREAVVDVTLADLIVDTTGIVPGEPPGIVDANVGLASNSGGGWAVGSHNDINIAAGQVCLIAVHCNAANHVISITGDGCGTFEQLVPLTNGIELWWAPVTGSAYNPRITANMFNTSGNAASAFGWFTVPDNMSPFDSSGSLPIITAGSGSCTGTWDISDSPDLLLFFVGGQDWMTEPGGWVNLGHVYGIGGNPCIQISCLSVSNTDTVIASSGAVSVISAQGGIGVALH